MFTTCERINQARAEELEASSRASAALREMAKDSCDETYDAYLAARAASLQAMYCRRGLQAAASKAARR